ncbi:MAG: DUF2339 domain-containing protein [Alphaproteobacteria bacterium]|nr:MAG: DUF2339 domain-containing protein [Alphaproteobacteria bacterium]TAF75216.1 MAG: DUF2339 domain-containing protein [Alphaproteobacteria bacterium]
MEILLALGFGFLFLASLVLPWINRSRIQALREEVDTMKGQMRGIFRFLEKEGVTLPTYLVMPYKTPWQQDSHVVADAATLKEEQPPFDESIVTDSMIDNFLKQSIETKERVSFEQQFGARLPVWIGGVALAFAGFFMVKYSIDAGLLSPTVRVVLGLMFGATLLYAAQWVRGKEGFANGTRIAQALSGAGIADLYVCMFAATSLYNFVPAFIGFSGMAVVTATAVILSLRHGMPIALLGLIGGFLTPAMIGSNDPSAPTLFIYLYFVITGILVVIRKKHWWAMAIPTVIGAFLWVCVWVFGTNFTPSDSITLGLFLMAVSATVVATSKQYYEEESTNITDLMKIISALNYLTVGGAMLLTGVIALHAGFGFMEWALFGFISLGGIGLAFFSQKLYGFVPWVSMAVNAVMLASWNTPDVHAFALTISIFGALYIGSGYLLQSRSERPLSWAGLTAAASIGYYLIGYYTLCDTEFGIFIPMFWGLLALIFAGLSTIALQKIIQDIPNDYAQKQHLMAIYAGAGTAFLSVALAIELPREFLSVAFAAQLCAMAWINVKVDVKALRTIVGILACVFGFLLMPQMILLVQLTAYSLVEAQFAFQRGIPIVNWPIFQLGLPALFFVAGSYLLRVRKDDRLVCSLEIAAIALIGVMGYYLTRHAFHVDENILFVKAGFIERGVITNIVFLYGLACLWIGKNYLREAVRLSGFVLCGVAVFRIGYFDFIAYNPLWSSQTIGEVPIFNALLLTYGVPILWTWKVMQELSHIGTVQWHKYGYGFILLLAFTLLSFNIRQLFHGAYLNGFETTNAEIYTYSVVWLLFGIALLFFGTLKKDKMMRIASLVIMILTVGKVFVYDASELEGLFRVFSFFGLGLSLLGLSWFYTRFVFSNRDVLEGRQK